MSTDKEVMDRIERDIRIYKTRHELLQERWLGLRDCKDCTRAPEFCRIWQRNEELNTVIAELDKEIEQKEQLIKRLKQNIEWVEHNKDSEIERLKAKNKIYKEGRRPHREEETDE